MRYATLRRLRRAGAGAPGPRPGRGAPWLPEVGVRLAGDGDEERLAELVHAEGLDQHLRLRRHHEIGEGLAAGHVNTATIGGVDLHDRVDVQERLVLLDEDGQADALLEREPGAAIGDRVRPAVIRDAERLAHALAGFDVPGALGLDPRLLPQPLLE